MDEKEIGAVIPLVLAALEQGDIPECAPVETEPTEGGKEDLFEPLEAFDPLFDELLPDD